MLLHRHHSFHRLGFHRRVPAAVSRSDKVTQGGFFYFHRQNPTIAVRGNKFLAEYEGKAEGKLQAKAGCSAKRIDFLLNAPLASLVCKVENRALFLR